MATGAADPVQQLDALLQAGRLKELGYAALADGWIFFMSAFAGMQATIAKYSAESGFPAPGDEVGLRNAMEEALRFEEMYRLEEQTTERQQ